MNQLRFILAVIAIGASVAAGQSQVKKSAIDGITNFAQVETTVACAGAVTAALECPRVDAIAFDCNRKFPATNGRLLELYW